MIDKKLRTTHKKVLSMYTSKYSSALDRSEMMADRKANEESARKLRAREMMEKL